MDSVSTTEKVLIDSFLNFYEALEQSGVLVSNELKVSVDFAKGEITLSDGSDLVGIEEVVYAWVVPDEGWDEAAKRNHSKTIRDAVKQVLATLEADGYFDQQIFMTPFTAYYSDTVSDKEMPIFKIEGGWTVMDKPLLKGWERELNGFFHRLLPELSQKK